MIIVYYLPSACLSALHPPFSTMEAHATCLCENKDELRELLSKLETLNPAKQRELLSMLVKALAAKPDESPCIYAEELRSKLSEQKKQLESDASSAMDYFKKAAAAKDEGYTYLENPRDTNYTDNVNPSLAEQMMASIPHAVGSTYDAMQTSIRQSGIIDSAMHAVESLSEWTKSLLG